MHVRTADKNLLAQVTLQAVHHAHDDDQRADADQHTANGDDANQRQETRPAATPQVAPRDRQLEASHEMITRGA